MKPTKETITDFFKENIDKLSQEDSNSCKTDIRLDEFYDTLQTCSDNKSPGSDGFPCEFYKAFWPEIKHLLYESYKYALVSENLSAIQKQGIISLIPKKDKDSTLLKNLRPITLLNFDYKLLAKCVATRIKVLPNIINVDQTGFLHDRYIGENLNRMHFSKVNRYESYLVTIGYEKAFDHIWRCLKYYRFGPKNIKLIKIYTEIFQAVQLIMGTFLNFSNCLEEFAKVAPSSPTFSYYA